MTFGLSILEIFQNFGTIVSSIELQEQVFQNMRNTLYNEFSEIRLLKQAFVMFFEFSVTNFSKHMRCILE